MSFTQQQVELKVQKGIRQAEDNLVVWIQTALDNRKSYGELQEAQFRNLVRVSDTTDSPEVIKNFLLYYARLISQHQQKSIYAKVPIRT